MELERAGATVDALQETLNAAEGERTGLDAKPKSSRRSLPQRKERSLR